MRFRAIPLAAALAALAALALSPGAQAQATRETAYQGMRLNVFGVGSYVRPEFGSQKAASGFAVGGGVGFTTHYLHRLEPAFDVRYSYATNSALTQTVFSGGPRIIYHVARFHPYGDVLIGAGNMNFKIINPVFPNYTHDNSMVITYGGGVDIDMTRTFALRVDAQEGRWKLEQGAQAFYPKQISVGLRYQFHFHNAYGPE